MGLLEITTGVPILKSSVSHVSLFTGREDRIPFEGGRAWAAGYQNVKLIAMSPAGHFPFLEHREQFFLAVNRFLQGYWPHEAEVVDR